MGGHLAWMLAAPGAAVGSPLPWLHVLLQVWLSTGLFITGHDAMHGTVSPNRRVNAAVGALACFLFAGMSYRRLVVNHRAHHADPTGDHDPDFAARGLSFWPWFGAFMVRYTTWTQIAVMAVKFNVLLWLGVPQSRLLAFWVLPVGAGHACSCSTSAPTGRTGGRTTEAWRHTMRAPCRATTCGPCCRASSSATTGSTITPPVRPGGGCGG